MSRSFPFDEKGRGKVCLPCAPVVLPPECSRPRVWCVRRLVACRLMASRVYSSRYAQAAQGIAGAKASADPRVLIGGSRSCVQEQSITNRHSQSAIASSRVSRLESSACVAPAPSLPVAFCFASNLCTETKQQAGIFFLLQFCSFCYFWFWFWFLARGDLLARLFLVSCGCGSLWCELAWFGVGASKHRRQSRSVSAQCWFSDRPLSRCSTIDASLLLLCLLEHVPAKDPR